MIANKATEELIKEYEKLKGDYEELLDESQYAIKNLEKEIQELRHELYQENKKYEVTWSEAGFEEGHYKSDWGLGVFHNRYASEFLEGWGGEEDCGGADIDVHRISLESDRKDVRQHQGDSKERRRGPL